ncbi:MAG: hypothetical protein EHM33_02055 [Chloroflexi bacterium]|nr:MAG: hypothetical protein EHM33_02055 [Chloroflexota bacterium]
MDGYIIINAHGQHLTRMQWWGWFASAWVWSEKQKDYILAHCFAWTFKPTHIQRARLEHGRVVTEGDPVAIQQNKSPVN